jgi:hypothetical protein
VPFHSIACGRSLESERHQQMPLTAALSGCTLGDLHIDQRIALGKKMALGDVW